MLQVQRSIIFFVCWEKNHRDADAVGREQTSCVSVSRVRMTIDADRSSTDFTSVVWFGVAMDTLSEFETEDGFERGGPNLSEKGLDLSC